MTELDGYIRKLDREMRTGLLSLLVLTMLRNERGELYGYQIIERLKRITNGALTVPEGTIYPILHSLHAYGLVRTRWGISEDGPPRKYYRITEDGRRALEKGSQLWESLVRTSREVMEGTGRD